MTRNCRTARWVLTLGKRPTWTRIRELAWARGRRGLPPVLLAGAGVLVGAAGWLDPEALIAALWAAALLSAAGACLRYRSRSRSSRDRDR